MEPDVNLIVQEAGEETREILVWSHVMINASPYFRTLLDPIKFAEGHTLQQHDTVTVNLLDTNPDAMAILCDIWHLKSSRVSTSHITSDVLYELSLLVDKYDCAESIQPWPRIWFSLPKVKSEYPSGKTIDIAGLEKWIHICCHLGYDDEFESLIPEFLRRATDQDISGEPSEYFSSLSPSLQEAIKQRRQTCVQEFRQTCIDLVSDLEKGQSCRIGAKPNYENDEPQPGYENDRFNCSSMQLGNAILALRQHLGTDWQCECNWTWGLSDLYDTLKSIRGRLGGSAQLKEDYYGRSRSRSDHGACTQSDRFGNRIQKIYNATFVPLPFQEFGNMTYRTLTK